MADTSFIQTEQTHDVNTSCVSNSVLTKNSRVHKLINGKILSMNAAIGYCWCDLHKGYVNLKLLKEHECVKKQCPFLEKFKDHPYWVNKQKIKDDRTKGKAEKKIIKETEKTILERVRYLTSQICGVAVSDVYYQDGIYHIKCVSIRVIRLSGYKDIIEHEFKVKADVQLVKNTYQFKEKLYHKIRATY